MTVADLSTSALFKPLRLGRVALSHRIAMAPLTRFRADDAHAPQLPMVATYYGQRASTPGTMLLTEATFISPRASGYENAPGLWDPVQLAAWRQVTDAVHARGSYIFVQLWALGRAADERVLREQFALDVVSSSAVRMPGSETVPRELTEEEIREYIKEYAQAAKNAVEIAGFDGVEIHGANGYLIDQFIQDTVNHRTDQWGGSIENRSRFGLEVARAVVDAVGPDRVGVRLSPWSDWQGMGMADPVPQFTHLIRGLGQLKLAYLHLVESRVDGNDDTNRKEPLDFALEAWGDERPVLIAGGFTPALASEWVDRRYKGRSIVVVFGRYFTANPDLPFRVRKGIPLAPYNRAKFYNAKEADGYITYPFSEEFVAQYGN